MSAWIVCKEHIDALVNVIMFGPKDGENRRQNLRFSYSHDGAFRRIETCEDADRIGQVLWLENAKSVQYRYPDDKEDDLPGVIGFSPLDAQLYVFPLGKCRPLTVVEALKAIDCLSYQSCEHDEWEASEAHTVLDILKNNLISELPGYNAAPWGIDNALEVA